MAKWADNLISAVSFNDAGTHITKVWTHADEGKSVGKGYLEARSTVVANIEAGQSYSTILPNGKGWTYGARVLIDKVDGETFIKTKPDSSKKDILDKPPPIA